MKTITYNPETHVLVPREPSEEMCDAATADSCWENMNPPPSTAYRLMIAAAPQPEPNHNWCAGCSPDNCSGCGAEPVDSEPAMWVMKHIRSGDLAQAKPNQKALHPRMWSQAHLYTTPQPDRVAELEADLEFQTNARIQDRKDAETNYKNWNAELKKQLAAAQEDNQKLRIALAKINEVLHD